MIYHIAKDPSIKQRCIAEIEELFGEKPIDYVPTLDELKKISYLRKVIKETLRLYPGAPLRGRTLIKGFLFSFFVFLFFFFLLH